MPLPDRILRRRSACEKAGLSPSGLDRLEAAGNFPKRIQITPHQVGWSEREIDEWIAVKLTERDAA
jgi:prophage regulatory protein